MKVRLTGTELRECVYNAVKRIINEGKNFSDSDIDAMLRDAERDSVARRAAFKDNTGNKPSNSIEKKGNDSSIRKVYENEGINLFQSFEVKGANRMPYNEILKIVEENYQLLKDLHAKYSKPSHALRVITYLEGDFRDALTTLKSENGGLDTPMSPEERVKALRQTIGYVPLRLRKVAQVIPDEYGFVFGKSNSDKE